MEYYKMPLLFENIVNSEKRDKFIKAKLLQKGNELSKVKLNKSIKQNIHLIMSTKFDEYRYDPDFGCAMWEKDFDFQQQVSSNQSEIAQSIKAAILNNEKRLINIKVNVKIASEEYVSGKNSRVHRTRNKVSVIVSGDLKTSRDPFKHAETLYFNPASAAD